MRISYRYYRITALVLIIAFSGWVLHEAQAAPWSVVRVQSVSTVKISAHTKQVRQSQATAVAKRKKIVRQQHSIGQYFQYLESGALKPKKSGYRLTQATTLYQYQDTPTAGAGSITPTQITKDEFLQQAPSGPMYTMVNWWCSAAAVYLSYTPNANTAQKLGLFSGDCTNPNAFLTGNFDPQLLGTFDPAVPLTFTLRNVDPEDQTIISKTSDEADECTVNYFKSYGHRDVFAAQYTCDDGFNMGVKDDIQFTTYIFPSNWPDSANVEAVLKKEASDPDKDGLIWKVERLIGTDPNDADTDHDGLKDGDEYLAYQTSPLIKDTDGNGVDDKTEVQQKTNPLGPGNATNAQLERWSRLKNTSAPVISGLNVIFSSGQATVSWTTDLTADGIVNWGPTTAYGTHRSDFAFTKSHAITFTVAGGTTYHYAVRACSIGPNGKCTSTSDFTFTAPVAGAESPTLSNVLVASNSGYVSISWTSNIATDGLVNFGPTVKYDSSRTDATFTASHNLSFPVTSGTTYHYSIRGCTADGVCATTSDATFTVVSIAPDITIPTTPTTPTISGLTATTENGIATVAWTTDIFADGIINWGTTTAYGTHNSDFSFLARHAISFAVSANTTYHYVVRACTAQGKCTTSADATFTAGAGAVAPALSGATVTFSSNLASVTWITDVSADGIVNWGTTIAYGSHLSDFAFSKSHTITFGVVSGNTYHYTIRACTSTSLCTSTADATFTAP